MLIGGHWHQNRILNYEGVPGILGRSPDRGKEIGYNIMEIRDGEFTVHERILVDSDGKVIEPRDREPWYTQKFTDTPQYEPDKVSVHDNP